MVNNPFILYGYESEEYFCDRKKETEQLYSLVRNGNNVALIAPRRIGKTGLIETCSTCQRSRGIIIPFLLTFMPRRTWKT